MQLFHEEHIIQKNILTISNPDTITQCRKVLRLKANDLIHVQSTKENTTTRHLIKICTIEKTLTGEIIKTQKQKKTKIYTQMLIALPNKRDKLELITQKLTEIGIDEIIFRPAERSIIKQRNHKKEQRLLNIMKEATEQSRRRFLPQISFKEHPENNIQAKTNIFIFDKKETTPTEKEINSPKKIGIIGPEGGLTQKDYKRFENHPTKIINLGGTILRMETAAIIGGRRIKQEVNLKDIE